MKTVRTFLLIVVIFFAGGFAIHTARETNHNRVAIGVLESDRQRAITLATTAGQRLGTAHGALTLLEQKRDQVVQGQTSVKSELGTAAGQKTLAKSRPARRLSPHTIIANDPRLMAEYAKYSRLSYEVALAGADKALGLSAEQVEKLKDFFMWHRQDMLDFKVAAEKEGLDPGSEGYQRLQTEQSRVQGRKVVQMLGDLAPQFDEWTLTRSVRNLVQNLAGMAIDSGESVTSDQVERTTQILAAHAARIQSGTFRGSVDTKTIDWTTSRAQLQGVLSPTQIATLGDIIEYGATQRKTDAREARLTAEFNAKQPRK